MNLLLAIPLVNEALALDPTRHKSPCLRPQWAKNPLLAISSVNESPDCDPVGQTQNIHL